MSICWSRTPYNQDPLPDLTQATSEELQLGSNDDKQAIWGKLAEHKRCKAKVQEEAQLTEEAWLEAERQEQAQLKEERVHAEAEAQRVEAVHKAEEARKAEESQQADALVGSSTGARSNIQVMNPWCLCCDQTNMVCICSTDSKKWHLACNQCNELKEHCWWLVEGETGQGAGLAVNKGKRKADMTSPHTGEKKKKKKKKKKKSQKLLTKVIEGANDEEVKMIAGRSKKASTGKVTGEETRASSVTSDQMECLIKAVEHVTDNVAGLAVAQKEVSRNFYWFAWSYETYVEEHFKFLALDVPSDWDTTDKEDRDIVGLEEELEGLREEEEEGWSQSESGDWTGASSAGSQA
ncbi:hypothetical protein M404DRAFT_18284 [Pisolithus tinctorius Marx 270]|uniref:Uncharacterized protein n=1 Tax=Pisolithus tinctorius Marx 270 TaxID=870435 RepID=A0A0C3PX76_PISTI|nr:hypothetical protein M404DRAFT_18284 [Pisolithus tinctorius Marx 270]